jgi:subtilisin family serine protease
MNRGLLGLSFLAFSACAAPLPQTEPGFEDETESSAAAVKSGRFLRAKDAEKGSYLVVLNEMNARVEAGDESRAASVAQTLAASYRGSVKNVFAHALRGFSAALTEKDAKRLAMDPNVAFVQENGRVQIEVYEDLSDEDLLEDSLAEEAAQRTGVTWGLDRLDQQDLPLNKQFNPKNDGRGVTAYIIDTGIRPTHSDFGGRVQDGFSSIADGKGSADCHGHGSHVAGTVAGNVYGVAREAGLVPVRVLDCRGSGTDEGVILGIEWVTKNAKLPAVANMSLGGDASAATDEAVKGAVAQGVVMVVAAGNDNSDACKYSPAREPSAITVAATSNADSRPMFSNKGKCVDLFAPGKSITSVNGKNDSGSTTMSGTSMASPHVAGAVALYLSSNPDATPEEATKALVDNASKGKVGGFWGIGSGSPNLLLNVQWIGASAL